jgi:hypothetical protein
MSDTTQAGVFYYNDEFYNMEQFMHMLGIESLADAKYYLDDLDQFECEETTLELIFQVTDKIKECLLSTMLEEMYNRNEDRYPLNDIAIEQTEKDLKAALIDSIDFVKLQSALPKLYYPNGKKFTITKKDILQHFENG